MKEIKNILASIRIADDKYNLIEKGDKIAIGISGGKDSMTLLYALNLYSKFDHCNFEIVPVILDLGFDNFNPEPLKTYIKQLGYNLVVYDARTVYPILKANQKDKNHLPCSICSRMKKCVMDKAAKELGCNKVAFAHHVTDAIETLAMNAIYGGRLATFSPKMHLTKDDITFIRPLILVNEASIKKVVKEENIMFLPSTCPADKHTEREEIKNDLELVYTKYPSSKQNFINMLNNMETFDIWQDKEINHIEQTPISIKEVRNVVDAKMFYKYSKTTNKILFNYSSIQFLILKKDKVVGEFQISVQKPNILLEYFTIFSKNNKDKYEDIVLGYLEKYLYKTYNPCIFKTSLSLPFFAKSYKKDKKFFFKKLEKNMKDIDNKK